MSMNCRDSEERSLAVATIIMSANLAAVYGAQVFRADDKPLYRRAFNTNFALLTSVLSVAAGQYRIRREKPVVKP
jgi:hypothetical protein